MSQKSRAAAYMLASSISFALMAVMVRFAGNVPVVEKVFVRNIVALMIAAGIALRQRAPLLGSRKNLPMLLGRSAFGVLGSGQLGRMLSVAAARLEGHEDLLTGVNSDARGANDIF